MCTHACEETECGENRGEGGGGGGMREYEYSRRSTISTEGRAERVRGAPRHSSRSASVTIRRGDRLRRKEKEEAHRAWALSHTFAFLSLFSLLTPVIPSEEMPAT